MADSDYPTELRQVADYRFEVRFEGAPYPPITVDEPPPTGGNAGPNPTRSLAMAVGHCMSSTLFDCFQRAHVEVRPFTTTVHAFLGRSERGRLRVQRLEVAIQTDPVHEADRARFDHCVQIFEDFCPVSGAVRDGAKIQLTMRSPREEPRPSEADDRLPA